MTHNTLMTQLEFATMLGVQIDNHGVKNFLKSLTKGNVLITSKNKRNQMVFSLTPTIKFHLNHEILPTNQRYIDKIVAGNECTDN